MTDQNSPASGDRIEAPMLVATCPECDGLGEWDEGPINTHSGWCDPADPIYRQVKCAECGGTGKVFLSADEDQSDD